MIDQPLHEELIQLQKFSASVHLCECLGSLNSKLEQLSEDGQMAELDKPNGQSAWRLLVFGQMSKTSVEAPKSVEFH